MPADLPPRRYWVAPAILLLGPVAGAAIGAATNALNVSVSPLYFEAVLDWVDDVPSRAIGQGAFEGALFGAAFGFTVAIAFAAATHCRGTFDLAARALGVAVFTVLACWSLGGVVGVLISATQPAFFSRAPIHLMAANSHDFARFAWVGGTIWGAYAGTLIAAIASCVWLQIRWCRACRAALAGFEPVALIRPAPAVAPPGDRR
jgi:hypothetical protein